jgi:hypothetical protein
MFYPSIIGSSFASSSYAMSTATAAENAAREAGTKVEIFQHDIDRLLLITEALWTVIKRERGYTDDTLVALIQDIERQKTSATGVTTKDPPMVCPACGRPNTAARSLCIYCGKPLPMKPFAR